MAGIGAARSRRGWGVMPRIDRRSISVLIAFGPICFASPSLEANQLSQLRGKAQGERDHGEPRPDTWTTRESAGIGDIKILKFVAAPV